MHDLEDIEYYKATAKDIEDVTDFRMMFLNDYKNHEEDLESQELKVKIRSYLENAIPSNKFIVIMARDENGIIASGGMEVRDVAPRYGAISNGKMGYIMNMYTLPLYRRKGIGKKILELLKEEAVNAGIKHLHLHASVLGDNIYREAGFEEHELPELVLELK